MHPEASSSPNGDCFPAPVRMWDGKDIIGIGERAQPGASLFPELERLKRQMCLPHTLSAPTSQLSTRSPYQDHKGPLQRLSSQTVNAPSVFLNTFVNRMLSSLNQGPFKSKSDALPGSNPVSAQSCRTLGQMYSFPRPAFFSISRRWLL